MIVSIYIEKHKYLGIKEPITLNFRNEYIYFFKGGEDKTVLKNND
jgi:hypothetical protein